MPVSIALSPDAERRLSAVAERTGRSQVSLLQDLVEQGLDDLEDYAHAIEVRNRVRSGTESVTSLDTLERELDLAG